MSGEKGTRSLGIAVVAALLLASLGGAQEDRSAERGFHPERSYDLGEIDHINNFNGNLVVSIPIGQTYRVSPQLSYQFTLTWNSNVWDAEADAGGNTRYFPNRVSNAGFGWYFGLGRLIQPGQPGNASNNTAYPLYLGPDGRKVQFYETLHPDDADEPGETYTNVGSEATLYSRDGSYLRLLRGGNCQGGLYPENCDWVLNFPNGVSHAFEHDDGFLTQMSDRFGNAVTITRTATTWTIHDPHRTQYINFAYKTLDDGQLVPMVSSADLAAFGGNRVSYDFIYSPVTSIPRAVDLIDPNVDVTFLDGVSEADGWSLSMQNYDVASTNQMSGTLGRLQLPTGGGIGWTYQYYKTPTGSEQPQEPKINLSVGVATRSTYPDSGSTAEGVWTYDRQDTQIIGKCSLGAPAKSVWRSVVTPLGHKTERYFVVWPCGSGGPSGAEFGLPYSAEASDDDPASGAHLSEKVSAWDSNTSTYTPVRSTYVKYEWDDGGIGVGTGDPRNQRLSYTKTVYQDDSGHWKDVTSSDFDGLGHYRQQSTNGDFASSNVHTSLTDFNPGQGYPVGFTPISPTASWLIGLYDRVDESEGGDTSRRLFSFDATTGFLNCVRTLATGTSNGAHDLLVRYRKGLDVDGRDGFVTRERFYGGDRQSIGTSGACSNGSSAEYTIDHTYRYGSRRSSQYLGVSWKALDLEIDANTGLTAKSFDPAALETDLVYDKLGRLTESRPLAKVGIAKDAWTQYEYQLGAGSGVTTRTCPSSAGSCSSSNDLTRQVASIDGLGRVWKEQTLLPDGSLNKRITSFDAMGHKNTVSTWVAGGTSANHVTTYFDYDPFGRPARIQAPDAEDTFFVYTGDRIVETTRDVALGLGNGEAGIPREATFDRQGRLWRVREYSNPAAPSTYVKTDYTYDEAGRLIQVCQNSSGSSCAQTRLFDYDNRGFLLSETHPEKGASGNGSVYYKTYDSRGHVWKRRDGADTAGRELDFTFDAAERLLTVQDNGGTTLKQFTYDTAAGAGAGKLATAYRRNDLGAPWNANYKVTETYEYSGRMGRASKRTTQLAVGGVNQESWELSQSYDELGAVTSIDYPRCFGGDCGSGAGTPARTQSFTRTHGALTAVPGWASSITYHPNLLVASVHHTNGTVDTITNDPDSMALPASISIDPGDAGDPTTTLGPYDYDGSGNVKSIGPDLFQYDKVSRLLQGQLGSLPVTRTQSYAFDTYGNLTATTTDGVTANTPASTSTNRLTGTATYDAAGNQTSWNGQSYSYDLFNMMMELDTGAEHWGYVYTADDERLIALLDDASNPLTNWTVRDLGNEVLTRDDHYPAAGSPPPLPPETCPGANGIFCDDFEEGTVGAWSSNSGLVTRTTTDYIHRDGQLLAASTLAGGGAEHFSLDHLGTPRVVTDDIQGSVVATHTYFPFGEEATPANQDAEPRKFTGHERDLQTSTSDTADDLDYMHARFRSPLTGRFLVVDEFEPWIGLDEDQAAINDHLQHPQAWNRYAYTMGNPTSYIDPDGQAAQAAIALPAIWIDTAGAAAAGTIAGGVVLAGGAGYVIGTGINHIPGVSDYVQGALGSAIDLVSLATNTKQRVNTVWGKIAAANVEIGKMMGAGGPDKDPAGKHHKTEIKAMLKKALKQAKRLPTKLRDAAQQKIQELAQRAGVKL